jgi:hypothetical protein
MAKFAKAAAIDVGAPPQGDWRGNACREGRTPQGAPRRTGSSRRKRVTGAAGRHARPSSKARGSVLGAVRTVNRLRRYLGAAYGRPNARTAERLSVLEASLGVFLPQKYAIRLELLGGVWICRRCLRSPFGLYTCCLQWGDCSWVGRREWRTTGGRPSSSDSSTPFTRSVWAASRSTATPPFGPSLVVNLLVAGVLTPCFPRWICRGDSTSGDDYRPAEAATT